MRTIVTITIDTEPSIAGALTKPDYYVPKFEEPIDGLVADKSEGLGFLIKCFSDHDIQATFFVETLHTRYFGYGPMRERCQRLQDAGQDVQLHIHPCWRSFQNGVIDRIDKNDKCWGRPPNDLINIFDEAQTHFEALTRRHAQAARVGGFAANTETYPAMNKVGINITSNICTAFSPPHDESLRLPGGRFRIGGVLELPVTCFESWTPQGRKMLRPLQICACSTQEICQVLDQANLQGLEHVVIVTHPFEFLKKRDFTYQTIKANRLIQKRLEQLCSYLKRHTNRFEIASMGQCANRLDHLADCQPAPLSVAFPWTAKRLAENAANDAIWTL